MDEVRVMSSLHHKNIVSYFGAQHMPEEGQLRILMEYCPGGSLKQALAEFDRFPEPLVQHFTHQMLQVSVPSEEWAHMPLAYGRESVSR